jgi:hypothetical protein
VPPIFHQWVLLRYFLLLLRVFSCLFGPLICTSVIIIIIIHIHILILILILILIILILILIIIHRQR